MVSQEAEKRDYASRFHRERRLLGRKEKITNQEVGLE
jgi:hypothetical protein